MKSSALIVLLLTTAATAGEMTTSPPTIDWSKITTISSPSFSIIPDGMKTVVTVHPDGKVTLGEGVTLDEASKAFWDQLQRMGMKMACQKSE